MSTGQYYKLEFLFEGVTKNVHAAGRYMLRIRKSLEAVVGLSVRLCFEGNADSWSYLYVKTVHSASISFIRSKVAEINLPPGVKLGMVYDILDTAVVTPGNRTIAQVFAEDLSDLDALATFFWAELLMGKPVVTISDGGEVVIRTGLILSSDGNKLSWGDR